MIIKYVVKLEIRRQLHIFVLKEEAIAFANRHFAEVYEQIEHPAFEVPIATDSGGKAT